MAVLVPVYWYKCGPTVFLYFCDIALFLTLYAVWTNSSVATSTAAVGIIIPQLFWCVDFFFELNGYHLSHLTAYMVDTRLTLFLRSLSLYHVWLPFLLIYLLYQLGYDKRGLFIWTAIAWVACIVSFCFLPPSGAIVADLDTPINVNMVFGFDNKKPQDWLDPVAYLIIWMFTLFTMFFLPAHFILLKLFKPANLYESKLKPN